MCSSSEVPAHRGGISRLRSPRLCRAARLPETVPPVPPPRERLSDYQRKAFWLLLDAEMARRGGSQRSGLPAGAVATAAEIAVTLVSARSRISPVWGPLPPAMEPAVALRLRKPEHLVHVMIQLGVIRPSFPGSPQDFVKYSDRDYQEADNNKGSQGDIGHSQPECSWIRQISHLRSPHSCRAAHFPETVPPVPPPRESPLRHRGAWRLRRSCNPQPPPRSQWFP